MIMIVPLRTKPSGLYRHRRGLGFTRSRLQRESNIRIPSLSSTQRRVPSGHGMKSWVLYLHGPTVRPKDIIRMSRYPLIQDSLNTNTKVQQPTPMLKLCLELRLFVKSHSCCLLPIFSSMQTTMYMFQWKFQMIPLFVKSLLHDLS